MYSDGNGGCLGSRLSFFLAVVGEGEGGASCTKLCETFLVSGATP